MTRYVIVRSLQALFAMWLVSLLIFGVSEVSQVPLSIVFALEPVIPAENLAVRYVSFLELMFLGISELRTEYGIHSPVIETFRAVPKTVYLLAVASAWAITLCFVLAFVGNLTAAGRIRSWVRIPSLLVLSVPIHWIVIWIFLLGPDTGWLGSEVARLLAAASLFGLLLAAASFPRLRQIAGQSQQVAGPVSWMNRAYWFLRLFVSALPGHYSVTAAVLFLGLALVEIFFRTGGVAGLFFGFGIHAAVLVLSLVLISGYWIRDITLVRHRTTLRSDVGCGDDTLAYGADVGESRASGIAELAGHRWIAVLLAVFVILAIAGPVSAPHDPALGDLDDRLKGPSLGGDPRKYLMGTDHLGRDILSRVLDAYRIAFGTALFSVALAIAVAFGLWRVVESSSTAIANTIDRLIRAYGMVPAASWAMVLMTCTLGNFWVFFLVGSVLWPIYYHQAKNHGAAVRPLAALAAFHFAFVILLATAVGILGAALPPPTPELGIMIGDGLTRGATAWWVAFWPGLAVLLTVFGFFLIGQWLADGSQPTGGEGRPLLDGGLYERPAP